MKSKVHFKKKSVNINEKQKTKKKQDSGKIM